MSNARRGSANRFGDLITAVTPHDAAPSSAGGEIVPAVGETPQAIEQPDVPPTNPPISQASEIPDVPPSGISLKRNPETADGETVRTPAVQSSEAAASRPVGRPAGKKSDPNYFQLGSYIPVTLHDDIKITIAMLNARRRRMGLPPLEISSVVEKLLDDWLKVQKAELSIG